MLPNWAGILPSYIVDLDGKEKKSGVLLICHDSKRSKTGANTGAISWPHRRFPTFDWVHTHNVHLFASPLIKRAYIMKLIFKPD